MRSGLPAVAASEVRSSVVPIPRLQYSGRSAMSDDAEFLGAARDVRAARPKDVERIAEPETFWLTSHLQPSPDRGHTVLPKHAVGGHDRELLVERLSRE